VAIQRLEAAVARRAGIQLSYFYPLMSMAPQRILLAELYAARGDAMRAAKWLASFNSTWAVGDAFFRGRVEAMRQRLGDSAVRSARCGETSATP
jgi:hypothetical protein